MEDLYHPRLKEITLPGVLHALGDPSRLRIARSLYIAERPLTCLEGVRGMSGLAISTRSHCYKLLREGGVIHADKEGRECYNTIRKDELEQKFPGLLEAILR